MSEKQRQGAINRWAKVPATKRSKTLSKVAQARMDKLTDRQKKLLGRKLTRARLEKQGRL